MEQDTWLKLFVGTIGGFISYIVYGIQRNTKRHDTHDSAICKLKQQQAVTDNQLDHIVSQLDQVIDTCTKLSANHDLILKQLIRNSRK